MKSSIEQVIAGYERALNWLDDKVTDTADTAAFEALNCRDRIQDDWSELTSVQREEITNLDKVLKSKKNILAVELPPFPNKPPERWWWTFYA